MDDIDIIEKKNILPENKFPANWINHCWHPSSSVSGDDVIRAIAEERRPAEGETLKKRNQFTCNLKQ